MLYREEEWQGGSGLWYCGHTASFPKDVALWLVPARMMGISADEFLKWLITKHKPDNIYHNEDCSFVGWSWKSQAAMRKYKNEINALARKLNFQV